MIKSAINFMTGFKKLYSQMTKKDINRSRPAHGRTGCHEKIIKTRLIKIIKNTIMYNLHIYIKRTL